MKQTTPYTIKQEVVDGSVVPVKVYDAVEEPKMMTVRGKPSKVARMRRNKRQRIRNTFKG